MALAGGTCFSQQQSPTSGDKPYTLIIPFSPGGGTDLIARIIAPKLSELLGSTVLVDNKPGASGVIAAQFTAKATPDGHTLMVGSTSEIGINPSLYPQLPYSPLRDFAAVTPIASTPMVLVVNPLSPIKSAKDLVAAAQANPGKINFGSAGAGSGAHMAAELFIYATKTKLVHIPYKGVGAALADVMGTEKNMVVFTSLPSIAGLVKSGQLRAVAVSTAKRVRTLPDVPTFIESGVPGYQMEYWYGTLTAAAAPAAVRAKIHSSMREVLKQPDVIASLDKQGFQPTNLTPEEFAAYIKSDMDKWSAVVTTANIRLNP